ncbi:fimbrial biogenesis chaperone [Enterobacter asburiae]|uniref:fimbrial biogenesis chaperone n=1 Tax=Enterobacter asburiae TaxID=61645 RepID=UPI001BE11BFD|nr:fimbria/pilus periplasmic chaperone [Enterobacter asburiae]MBT2048482.1 fimbria/pilus periplasmic chaperone [Enterobacter asburiae]
MKFNFIKIIYCFILMLLINNNAHASIVITGTRVIYKQIDQEVTVQLKNVGSVPVLAQSWIDNGDAKQKPDEISSPFIITPPINRLDSGKGQTLRIVLANKSHFATDRESVAWLNVLEIPAIDKEKKDLNILKMAFRTRIKLFYRPTGLAGDANNAIKSLTWSAISGNLNVKNPTPWHVSLVSVSVDGRKVEGEMIPPFSTHTFNVDVRTGNSILANYVNDYGAVLNFDSVVR